MTEPSSVIDSEDSNERKQRKLRAAAFGLSRTVESVTALIFETHAIWRPGETDESDGESINVELTTTPAYLELRDGGIGIRLKTCVKRSDCELTVDSALNFRWSEEIAPNWGDDLIGAFMECVGMLEVFGYQRPIFDDMVQRLDLPAATITMSEFANAVNERPTDE